MFTHGEIEAFTQPTYQECLVIGYANSLHTYSIFPVSEEEYNRCKKLINEKGLT